MLTKFKEGKFYLEDPSGAIPIDFSRSKYSFKLYNPGTRTVEDSHLPGDDDDEVETEENA